MSMLCPRCDAKGKCVDTRRYQGGHEVYRRYQCNAKCKGLRWSTVEQIASVDNKKRTAGQHGVGKLSDRMTMKYRDEAAAKLRIVLLEILATRQTI